MFRNLSLSCHGSRTVLPRTPSTAWNAASGGAAPRADLPGFSERAPDHRLSDSALSWRLGSASRKRLQAGSAWARVSWPHCTSSLGHRSNVLTALTSGCVPPLDGLLNDGPKYSFIPGRTPWLLPVRSGYYHASHCRLLPCFLMQPRSGAPVFALALLFFSHSGFSQPQSDALRVF